MYFCFLLFCFSFDLSIQLVLLKKICYHMKLNTDLLIHIDTYAWCIHIVNLQVNFYSFPCSLRETYTSSLLFCAHFYREPKSAGADPGFSKGEGIFLCCED